MTGISRTFCREDYLRIINIFPPFNGIIFLESGHVYYNPPNARRLLTGEVYL